MLHFNSILSQSILSQLSPRLFPYWRVTSLLSTNVINPEASNVSKQDDTTLIQDSGLSTNNQVLQKAIKPQKETSKIPGSVKHFQHKVDSKVYLENKIKNAKSIQDLVNVMKSPGIAVDNVKEILHLISSKNENMAKNKSSLTEPQSSIQKVEIKKLEKDNSNILSLATPSLIQMLKQLSFSSDRNVPVLKTLAHNITTYSERLNVKMCSDILYSLSVLNYYDKDLIDKVILDLILEIPKNRKASVFGSIVTSLGLLRYKNHNILDIISQWVVDNYEQLRVQDFIGTLQCFATFGYKPKNMSDLQRHIYSLKKEDVKENDLWLDFVWSLTILDEAFPTHMASVLNPAFIKILLSKEKQVSKILKILNINGAAQVLQANYNGPLLNTADDIFSINIERRKQKQEYVELLKETLAEIAPFCFATNVNTKMGFFIDAVCCIDSNNEFIKLDNDLNNKEHTKIALMVYDYYDYSRGEKDHLGIINFSEKILTATNYKVLSIPYCNFSVNDKLIKRVKYLSDHIKSIQNL